MSGKCRFEFSSNEEEVEEASAVPDEEEDLIKTIDENEEEV
jgi:hypothetical protein